VTTHERLICKCGGEVGLVRLNPETLVLGHRVNPRNNRHAVRLARASLTALDRAALPEPASPFRDGSTAMRRRESRPVERVGRS
jgi:hypothetical protein